MENRNNINSPQNPQIPNNYPPATNPQAPNGFRPPVNTQMPNSNQIPTYYQATNNSQLPKKMKLCKTCGAAIAKNAKRCPSCGAKNKKPLYKSKLLWIICIILIIVGISTIYNLVQPGRQATIYDKNGNPHLYTQEELLHLGSNTFQEEIQGQRIVLTGKIKKIGSPEKQYVNNEGDTKKYEFNIVTITLTNGWRFTVAEDAHKMELNLLHKGDTIKVQSVINSVYLIYSYSFISSSNNIKSVEDGTTITIIG